jgi:carbamoyl-phosphate synthase large subunit
MVTGIGGGALGEQIIKALRISEIPYWIIGGDANPHSSGFGKVDQAYLLPMAKANDYIPCLSALCRNHGVQVLLPGSEPELNVISKHRKELEALGVMVLINPPGVLDICLDKTKTMQFLKDNGFSSPLSQTVETPEPITQWDLFPCIMKPVSGGGSKDVFLAQNPTEAVFYANYLLSRYKYFMVQEYVGTPHDEYTVGVLLGMDGKLINSIAIKRDILNGLSNRLSMENKTDRRDLGPLLAISSGISQGEIGKFPKVTEQCQDIALALGCRGAVNLQCRYVEGKVYIFEINPRFSGTTSLRAMAGYNEPDILIRKHLLGEKIKPGFGYKHGFIARGLTETMLSSKAVQDARDLL